MLLQKATERIVSIVNAQANIKRSAKEGPMNVILYSMTGQQCIEPYDGMLTLSCLYAYLRNSCIIGA